MTTEKKGEGRTVDVDFIGIVEILTINISIGV